MGEKWIPIYGYFLYEAWSIQSNPNVPHRALLATESEQPFGHSVTNTSTLGS